MTTLNRRRFAGRTLAALLAAASMAAAAQDNTARILVGFPAGGSFDAIARILAEKLKTELNRNIIVDNKPGAGGRIAVDHLKKAPADGSVVMLGPDALVSMYPYTFRKLSYDADKDLAPITTVAEFAFGFATGADPKVNHWAEYVEWAKKNPAKASYGVPAMGAPHHFFGLMLGNAIGVPMQTVPFQGSAPINLALMGGQVSAGIDVTSSQVENHRGGKIRMLAVSSDKRIPQAPDVPTFAELGLPAVSGMGHNALYAPSGTPAAAIAAWHQAVAKALAQADVREKLFTMGYQPVGQGPEELARRQASAAKFWGPVIKASGYIAE
ncbi:MAG: Bug family tripartite tricarboxylate transporter substrate binding protein [Ramlibacter sp.]|nr:Bug family tripartite tricarboxylate transporter substrate binding protein [Ramlibacter sp.]